MIGMSLSEKGREGSGRSKALFFKQILSEVDMEICNSAEDVQ